MLDIAVVILTYNEALHIERCIRNVQPLVCEVFVVDSFSTDATVALARGLGAQVFQNKWEDNHARQFNWGLDHLPITAGWVLRLDADEYLTPELIAELEAKFPALGDDVAGVIFPRMQYFFGKRMHHIRLLRLFRRGKAVSEERWMDEHIQLLEGRAVEFEHLFLDDNLNPLGWWIAKHNGYSVREAIDLLDVELGLLPRKASEGDIGGEAAAKRARKLKYARQPLFWRSFAYFVWRYFFKLGFLQGRARFLWDFFQGWWYRTLVDAKIWEIRRACGDDREKILDFVRDTYGIDCRKP